MKPTMTKNGRKLVLSRETVRQLETGELAGVVGGMEPADTKFMNTCAATYYTPCTVYKCGPTWPPLPTLG